VNIAMNLEAAATRIPVRVALRFEGITVTYHALNAASNRAADSLRTLGVHRGDRVALFLPNSPDFVVWYFGVLKLGAIAVSLNPQLKHDEVGFVLADSGAAAVVTSSDLITDVPRSSPVRHRVLVDDVAIAGCVNATALLDEADAHFDAVALTADDPAAILYTSGTTGVPKGVVLSHGNVMSNADTSARLCGVRADDGLLLFVPLTHCFGQNAILNCGVRAGAAIVLLRRFVLKEVLAAIAAGHVTKFYGVPAVYIRLLAADLSGYDLRKVPYFFSAAANLPIQVAQRWAARFGRTIAQGYGLTETSPFASYTRDHGCRLGSVGTPIDGVEIRVVDALGRDVPVGDPGEIVIRGPNVMLGYWNRTEETTHALRDGWFHSGDVGRFDGDRNLYVVDRLKDLVNTAGFKVYPAEVENVLYRHAAIAEVAVYGVPDPVNGEQVRAAVVLRAGHAAVEDEIIAFCRARMAAYKVPQKVTFHAALPRNGTGKILKWRLVDGAKLSGRSA
jgi:long-chain acyl-CoA synthetase